VNTESNNIAKIFPDGLGIAYTGGLNNANGITIDGAGNLYVANSNQNNVVKITPDGVGTAVAANSPIIFPQGGIAVDHSGNIYVTENNAIAKILPDGTVNLLAGDVYTADFADGTGAAARFNRPAGLALDAAGNLYVADYNNYRIRKIDPTGTVTTFAGGTQGYKDGSIGGAAASASAKINVKVMSNPAITNTFVNQVLPVDGTGKATLPDYTSAVTLASSCSIANIKVTQSPVAGTVLNAGDQVLVTMTATYPADTSVSKTFTVTADPDKGIVFPAIADITYGSGDVTPIATPPVASTVSFTSSNSAVATIVNGKFHIVGVGTTQINATSAGQYVVSKTRPLTVDAAPLTISAVNLQKTYGAANPPLVAAYSGFVNAQDSTILTSTPVLSTAAVQGSNAGTYAITLSGAAAPNYAITFVPGTLTVNKAILTISGDTVSRLIGEPNPAFILHYSGFVNGDDQKVLTKQPVAATTATASSQIGGYPITIGGADAANYTPNYVPGVLIVSSVLPADNFTITTNSVTCKGSANGIIAMKAAQHFNYTATITGNGLNAAYPFTDSVRIGSLAPGTYNLCFTIAGQTSYSQCFTIIMTEPKDLSVYTAVDKPTRTVTLSLDGGTNYSISLNGVTTNTSSGTITLNLKSGDNDLIVTTDRLCQGTVETHINLSGSPAPYPNPFTSTLLVNLGTNNVPQATVKVFTPMSMLVFSKQFTNASGSVQVDLSGLRNGVYILELITGNSDNRFKIEKK
jgi:hypothetical protein